MLQITLICRSLKKKLKLTGFPVFSENQRKSQNFMM